MQQKREKSVITNIILDIIEMLKIEGNFTNKFNAKYFKKNVLKYVFSNNL